MISCDKCQKNIERSYVNQNDLGLWEIICYDCYIKENSITLFEEIHIIKEENEKLKNEINKLQKQIDDLKYQIRMMSQDPVNFNMQSFKKELE